MVGGQLKGFGWFLYKYRKVRGKRGFFPVRLVKRLVVRGTISSCNNKITIFPVGESVAWNVQMR